MDTMKNQKNEDSKPLVWDATFSVNANVLDEQHKALFSIMNELGSAREQNLEKVEILAIITKLYNYSSTHFRDEEALLEQKKFTGISDQQTHHAIFLDYVIDLERKVKAGIADVDAEIMTFLKVWWKEHILKMDKKYSTLF